jgi:hypothetical protein
MNIELSAEQFRSLLDLVYLGEMMAASSADRAKAEKYRKLESRIFSECSEAGLGKLAEEDEEDDGEVYPSAEFDASGVMDMIDDYNEDILFGTLAEALSKREVPAQLDGEERMDYIEAQYDKYMKEFDENGFDNISVDTGEKDMRTVKV